MEATRVKSWMEQVIRPEEYEKYLDEDGRDFIHEDEIESLLNTAKSDASRVREIIAKSEEIQILTLEECAVLLNVEDPALWEEIFAAALRIKQKVYGPRIVTFAPLYTSNYCVNNCLYCGFRSENAGEHRLQLTEEQLIEEVKRLTAVGHKRLVLSVGEHPCSGVDYLVKTLKTIYGVKNGNGEIRRVNVNCAPMCVDDLKKLKEVGIGTLQVFQETYHRQTYAKMHPSGLKSDFRWRLYVMHRAMEAGIDDMGIGALFGLYHWKFDVMGLLAHARELETRFGGVGPHTISFPRLRSADGTGMAETSRYSVNDRDFKRLVAVLRLSVPYTGMIVTAREPAAVRDEVVQVGCTQIDADSRIGIGAYTAENSNADQNLKQQQFELGDTRTLDQAIRDMAKLGYISGFCTACYRSCRTGSHFMGFAKDSKISHFCMPNAILTFKEYLLDYGSDETKRIGEKLIQSEYEKLDPVFKPVVSEYLQRLENGERDLKV